MDLFSLACILHLPELLILNPNVDMNISLFDFIWQLKM